MVFSEAERVGEKDKTCQSHVCQTRAGWNPFSYYVYNIYVLHIKKNLKCVTDHTAVLIQTSESRQFCLGLQLPLRMFASSASIAHACIATEAEENCKDEEMKCSQGCELSRDPDAFLIFFS